ncbi:hypothetical protein QJS10_CPB11g01882 [Acorus calamus]|uniref:Uncharacterized protein n=1 Tax=Acorus calamus TaxID=4465 RepID=A0AAV9DUM0_ACOCL|nr:hypothetical protein QJS10_CPB11g01882 [Acorus calamus]
MKIMLKWMMGKRMLQLFCTRAGNSKKFLLSTLPEDTKTTQPKSRDSLEPPGRHDFDTMIDQYLENSWKMKV